MSFQAPPQERAESLRSAHLAEVHANAKDALLAAMHVGDMECILMPTRTFWFSGKAYVCKPQSSASVLIDNITATHESQDSLASFIAGCLKSTDPDVRLKAELMVSVAAERFASDEEARAEEME